MYFLIDEERIFYPSGLSLYTEKERENSHRARVFLLRVNIPESLFQIQKVTLGTVY